jgi:hypothetical protein
MKEYKLSKRSIQNLKEFNGLVEHGNLLQSVLAFTPFALLLSSKPTPVTTIEIASSDWAEFATAMKSASIIVKAELKKFCDNEIFHQSKSRDDVKFWTEVKKSLN